jgi:serine/threonine protein kinase
VLADDNGRIKLIDFGLCHIEDGQAVTLTEEAVGTPHYRAPECSGHSRFEPDIRADLYSAGKILWAMITNKPAFDRENRVFTDLSLFKELPDLPLSWHLHHIFELTIRHNTAKRYPNTFQALQDARNIRHLVAEGYKPLEQLADGMCPICGIGRYDNIFNIEIPYQKELERFTTHMRPISGCYYLCPFCFHASFVATEALQKALADRRKLE